MKKIGIIIFASLLFGVAHAAPVVDITKIAGKSESYVAKHLGRPISCGSSKYGNKCQYKKGETEIIFINRKAD